MNLNGQTWQQGFLESPVVGVLANSPRGAFQIPAINALATFMVRTTAFTGGGVTLKLRFGSSAAYAANSIRGIDFRLLNANTLDDFGTVAFVGAAPGAGPGAFGAAPGIVPPFVEVIFDSLAATNLTYQVLYCLTYYT